VGIKYFIGARIREGERRRRERGGGLLKEAGLDKRHFYNCYNTIIKKS
jgi:hypothetical protein